MVTHDIEITRATVQGRAFTDLRVSPMCEHVYDSSGLCGEWDGDAAEAEVDYPDEVVKVGVAEAASVEPSDFRVDGLGLLQLRRPLPRSAPEVRAATLARVPGLRPTQGGQVRAILPNRV
jgi:hypothetical protein